MPSLREPQQPLDSSPAPRSGSDAPAKMSLSKFATCVSILASGMVLVDCIFRWDVVEVLTPFLSPVFSGAVWLTFCASALLAFYALVATRGTRMLYRVTPIAFTLTTLVLALTVDFTAMMLDLDFKCNLANRHRCVKELLSHFDKDAGMVKLPSGFGYLSKGGGDVQIGETDGTRFVLFYTYRGVLDNYSGFFYRDDDADLTASNGPDNYKQIKKLRDHWFFVAQW